MIRPRISTRIPTAEARCCNAEGDTQFLALMFPVSFRTFCIGTMLGTRNQ